MTPQVEVNGRRIGLVTTGSQGKLAVECDGAAWYSPPEQVASDFARELELRRSRRGDSPTLATASSDRHR